MAIWDVDQLTSLLTGLPGTASELFAHPTWHHPKVCLRVIERVNEVALQDPRQAMLIAETACGLTSLVRSPEQPLLEARAVAELGGVHRRLGNYSDARACYLRCGRILGSHHDIRMKAELCRKWSYLHRDQRCMEEARVFSAEATRLFHEIGDECHALYCLVDRAAIELLAAELDHAAVLAARALKHLRRDDTSYFRAALQIRLTALCRGDGAVEERELLRLLGEIQCLDLDAPADSLPKIYLRWLTGLTNHRLRLPGASEAFSNAVDGFLAKDLAHSAALAAMDLALHHFESGRMSDAQRLAWTVIPILQRRRLKAESLACLRIFHEASTRGALTGALILDLRRRIELSS